MNRTGKSVLPPNGPALQGGPERFGETGRQPGRRQTRFLAGAFTVAVHLVVLGVLLLPRNQPPPSHAQPPQPPIQVSLWEDPKPAPPSPPKVTLVEPDIHVAALPPPRFSVRAPMRPAATAPADDYSDVLSDSQVAGAATVGDGGGGGSCDLARVVQQALRRDPVVRNAVEDGHRLGKAMMLWNGDWVRSGGQDGKGLSAVREAVMWEVAFAPESCRNRPVHGTVLLSLADGSTRFAIGSGDWRWADLLGIRGGASSR